jgi:hypothetical protein
MLRDGSRKHLRERSLRGILRVTSEAMTEARLVPAGGTWRKIDSLLAEGFSRAELARRLGLSRPVLQYRRRAVTARTEARVERLYRTIMVGA